MGRLAGQFKPLNLIIVVLLLVVAVGGFIWRGRQINPARLDEERPDGQFQFVYDYARVFEKPPTDLNRFLEYIRSNHAIETVVVTYSKSPDDMTLPALARDLIEKWQIGQSLNGGGILLLVAVSDRNLHIGVSDGLKEIFTEQFRRHMQNWHWRTLVSAENIEPALSAVAAEIDRRAGLAKSDAFTKADVFRYDRDLPAGPPIGLPLKEKPPPGG